MAEPVPSVRIGRGERAFRAAALAQAALYLFSWTWGIPQHENYGGILLGLSLFIGAPALLALILLRTALLRRKGLPLADRTLWMMVGAMLLPLLHFVLVMMVFVVLEFL